MPIHDSVSEVSTQLCHLMSTSWEQEIVPLLPADVQTQARSTGAFVRVRAHSLRCATDLLRGLLAYVFCRSSLRQVGVWALLTGLADLSHVGWHRRLRQARAWLLWLLSDLLSEPAASTQPLVARRIVLIDATRLKALGGTGDDWRAHLGSDLVAGRLLDVKLTDGHTAEGLTHFPMQPGDVLVADRGYCRRPQLAAALDSGAHVLIRLAVHQVPLLDRQGRSFDVLSWLRQASGSHLHVPVAFEHKHGCYLLRLLATRFPEEVAERAREKERKKAAKQQREIKEETLFLCGWWLLLSSLPADACSDEHLMVLYRARWQIELLIKRMKQLLPLVQLRGQSAQTNEVILLLLLIGWALVQTSIQQMRSVLEAQARPLDACDEVDSDRHTPFTLSSWSITVLHLETLRLSIQGSWSLARLSVCFLRLRRFLGGRRARPHQETHIRRLLIDLFSCSSA